MNKQHRQTIFSDRSFRQFFCMVLFVLLISMPLLFLPKEDVSIWINQFHHPLLDGFFYYVTYLGDGMILLIILLYMLLQSYTWAAFFAGFTILEAGIVQLLLKKGLFASVTRPASYIPNFDQLHQVSGLTLHHLHSFPSGHTQTIFLVVTFIAMAGKRNLGASVLLVLLASLTALSRVYLLQHFLVDVWFGALIGFGLPVAGIYFWQKFAKFPSTEKRLILHRFRKMN